MDEEVKKLVERLELKAHPEGGFFKETYRAKYGYPSLPDLGMDSFRNFSTAIYFLLLKDNFSAFHRIRQDETWHFYAGSPLVIHMLSEETGYSSFHLGNDLAAGEHFQCTVPARVWFASETLGSYGLAGCTVAPGFDFRDFEMAERSALIEAFPTHQTLIERLTR